MKSVNTPKINVAKDENRNFHIYNMVSEQFDIKKYKSRNSNNKIKWDNANMSNKKTYKKN